MNRENPFNASIFILWEWVRIFIENLSFTKKYQLAIKFLSDYVIIFNCKLYDTMIQTF